MQRPAAAIATHESLTPTQTQATSQTTRAANQPECLLEVAATPAFRPQMVLLPPTARASSGFRCFITQLPPDYWCRVLTVREELARQKSSCCASLTARSKLALLQGQQGSKAGGGWSNGRGPGPCCLAHIWGRPRT